LSTHVCNLVNGALSGTRLASGDVLLDWATFAPDANTLGLWHMDEASWTPGQADCLDSSGNGNHLTLDGAGCNTFAGSWMNRGGNFMGSGRFALKTAFAPSSGPYTCEVWVYWNGTNRTSYRGLFGTGAFNVAGFYLELDHNTDNLLFGCYNSLNNLNRKMPSAAWTHYAVTCDGGTYVKLWENGVLVSTISRTTNLWRTMLGFGTEAGNTARSSTDTQQDEARLSNVERYTTTFAPVRYPASGTWTEASGEAEVNCLPGVLTATLAGALPTGTSLKAKLLSAAGGDTGWVTMTGSGTTYTYDFTGQVPGIWRAALQPFAGGALNINTPEVSGLQFAWNPAIGLFQPDYLGYMQPEYGVA
jgi:hypothetical protein